MVWSQYFNKTDQNEQHQTTGSHFLDCGKWLLFLAFSSLLYFSFLLSSFLPSLLFTPFPLSNTCNPVSHTVQSLKSENKVFLGTSLVVQWPRLHAPKAWGLSSIPGQGTRSHRPQLKTPHATTKIRDSLCHATKTQYSQINE